MKNNIIISLLLVCTITILLFVATQYDRDDESNHTTVIIPFAQGGDTDIWTTMLWTQMGDILGEEIEFMYITGGNSGSIGVQAVIDSEHDGYTICGTSETTLTIPVMVGDNCTAEDWIYFIAGGSQGVLCVRKDLVMTSIEELMEGDDSKGEYTIANTSGGLWFAQAKLFENYSGVPLEVVNYDGSSTAIQGCINGEADIVVASLSEVAQYIETGELVPLAVMDDEDYSIEGFGVVPAITTIIPELAEYFPLSQFLGFKVPSDTPIERVEQLESAFATVMERTITAEFAEEKVATIYNLTGDEAMDFVLDIERELCWILYELGVVNYSPEEFDIVK